ncbi:MarR family transcriptional regulator [Methylobacterium sp. DB0501]|nr:MarR family transcriptional regulator [Methylobacterium sp. DB0501]
MATLAIARLGRLLAKLHDVGLQRVGITASQLPVLAALKNGERRTQLELARLAGVEQPSMAQLLARMERDGLIRREPAPDDRRSTLVSLTDTALQRLEPGRDVLRAAEDTACAGLQADERAVLMDLIGRMASSVETAL